MMSLIRINAHAGLPVQVRTISNNARHTGRK